MRNINIKAVAKLTGINENTLRAWERRYNIVEPARSEDGHRLYSRKDIEKISLLWRLVQRGHLIGHLAELSVAQLKKLDEEAKEVSAQSPHSEEVQAGPEKSHLKAILTCLKSFDLAGVQRGLQLAKFELSPRAIVSGLVLPLLTEVGVQVMAGGLSIAQEHLLSSLLRDYLGNLYQSLAPYDYQPRIGAERVLLTTREGDLHEFGILLAAVLYRLNGHETYYLGPNMPVQDLAEACEHFKISILILGLSAIPKENELIAPDKFLKELDRLAPRRVNIFYGGSGAMEPISQVERKMIRFSSLHELDGYITRSSI